MNMDFFKNNPNAKNIDPQKLSFLMEFAAGNPAGDAKQMASTLMNAATTAKKKGVEFTPDETDLLIDLLKQNMSPEEQQKADKIVTLMKTMRRR